MISQEIDDLAADLDSLLSNRRKRPRNQSTVSLIGFMVHREGGQNDVTSHVLLDLRLPNFEEDWQFKFSSFDAEDEFEGNLRNRDGAQPREQKLGTSVGFLKRFGKVKTLFRPRIEFKNPLVTSMLVRFDGQIQFENWQLVLIKKFFTHSIDGVGQSFGVDLDRKITTNLVFRFFNEFQYFDQDNIFQVAQGPSLRYRISRSMALSNTLVFNSQSRNLEVPISQPYNGAGSYHLANYQYLVSFSHNILNRVFHYQVTPFLEFVKTTGFKGNAGLQLRTEIIF